MNKKSKESFWNSNSRFFGKDIPNKNLFAGILVFAILVLAIVLFVNSPENTVTGNTVVDDFVSLWNDGSDSGENGAGVIKFIFYLLLVMLIYSVLSFVGLFGKAWSFVLSLMVSFLAIVYLTPQEIYSTLLTYSAMGVSLLVFVPLIILILFSITLMTPFRLKDGKMVMYKRGGKVKLLQYFLVSLLWLLFIVLLISMIFKWGFDAISVSLLIVIGIVILFGIFMIFKPSWLAKLIIRSAVVSERNYLKSMRDRERERLKHIREMQDIQSGYDQGNM
jgi:hypothetical protein